MRRREVCPNSWSRHPNQMLFTPTTQWTFGENMWRSFMESPHFNTSSIRDKWHRWKSYSTSKRRHFCSTVTIRIGWKVVESDSMECCCYLRNVQDLLEDGKNSVWKTIWRTIPRANDTFWSNGWISSDFIGKKVLPGIFLGYESVAGWIGTRNFLIADLGKSERLDASEIYPWRINAKTKRWRNHIPSSRWYSKLSGVDYEFRENPL